MGSRQESKFALFLKKHIKRVTIIELAYIVLLLLICGLESILDSHPQNKYQDIARILSYSYIGLILVPPLLFIQLCILLYYKISAKWKVLNILLILLCPFTFFAYLMIIFGAWVNGVFSKSISESYEKSHYAFLDKAKGVDSLEIINKDSIYFYKSFILPDTKKKVAITLSHYQYRNRKRKTQYLELHSLEDGEWIKKAWQQIDHRNNDQLDIQYKDLNFDNTPDISIIMKNVDEKQLEYVFIINWNPYQLTEVIIKDNTLEYRLNQDSTLTIDYAFFSRSEGIMKTFSADYYWDEDSLRPKRIMKDTPEFESFEKEASIKFTTTQQMHLAYLQKMGINETEQQSVFLYCEEGNYIFGVNKPNRMEPTRSLAVNLHSGKTKKIW